MSEPPESPPPRKARWQRWLLYPLFLLAVTVGLLVAIDRVVGAFLPEHDFPPHGVASPPLEDKTIEYIDFRYTSSTNSMGLRDQEVGPESEHAFRIAAVGDSYTFGWGVENEDAWVRQLERLLRDRGLDVEVVNVGQPGAGPFEMRRNAKAAIDQLNPDMILLSLLQGNDLNQVSISPLKWPFFRYLPNLHRLRSEWDLIFSETAGSVPDERMVQSAETHNEYLREVAVQMRDGMSPGTRARYEQLDDEVKELFLSGKINPWMIFEAAENEDPFTGITDLERPGTRRKIRRLAFILEDIKEYAADAGASMVAVSVPNGVYDNLHMYERVQRLGYNVDPRIQLSDALDEAVGRACDAAGVPLVVVTDHFQQRADDPDLYFEFDHHFTPKGHALLAEQVAPEIAALIQ